MPRTPSETTATLFINALAAITPAPRNAIPSSRVRTDDHTACDGSSHRIMRSLYARIVQVVGIQAATERIHTGSKLSGHQHPPIADIVIVATEPIGRTASRVCATPAITKPNAEAANAIATVGTRSMSGLRPSSIPNNSHPIEKSTTICTNPVRKRDANLPTIMPGTEAPLTRSRWSVPQSRSSIRPIDTPHKTSSNRKVIPETGHVLVEAVHLGVTRREGAILPPYIAGQNGRRATCYDIRGIGGIRILGS